MRSGSLVSSFDFAIRGIVYALRTQQNMRIHMVAAALVVIVALLLRVSGLELVALLVAIAFVIIAELVNTAVEATVDLAVDGYDPLAAIAKDVAAGAVLVASLTAVAVGYIVLASRLSPIAQIAMESARRTSASITVIAVVLTGIAVVAIKALTHEKGTTFVRGGWPSGHTAIAVSIATAIGYSSDSAKAMVLALLIAGMVAQSRIDTGTHTVAQTVTGAVLGFLLTTAVFQLL